MYVGPKLATGKGRTADVYHATGEFEGLICLKIYRPQKVPADLETVIEAVQARAKIAYEDGRPAVGFIRGTLHEVNGGQLAGVAVDFVPKAVCLKPTFLRSKYAQQLTARINIATSIAAVVGEVHKRGLLVGDLSPANTLVDPMGYACIIDADSFGVLDQRSGQAVVPSIYSTPNYTAPELSKTGATLASDKFSLAVLVLETVLGRHPFTGVRPGENGATTLQTNIDAGVSWLTDRDVIAPPPFESVLGLDLLSEPLRERARQVIDGKQTDRPDATDWYEALTATGTVRCPHCDAPTIDGARICVSCRKAAGAPSPGERRRKVPGYGRQPVQPTEEPTVAPGGRPSLEAQGQRPLLRPTPIPAPEPEPHPFQKWLVVAVAVVAVLIVIVLLRVLL